MRFHFGRPGAGSVKVFAYPGIIVLQQPRQRVGDHAAVDDDTDAVARAEQGIEVVGDHDYGEAQLGMKVQQ